MKNIIAVFLLLISFTIFGIRITKKIEFEQNISGYLKRAAGANTIKLANEDLTKAIDNLVSRNLTNGYTSILYKTPDEDIEFWFRNLKASQNELQNLKSESALEKTNVLLKLRETLLETDKSTKVTVPEGLSVYPKNTLWAFLMTFAILASFSSFILFVADAELKSREKAANKI